MFLSYFVFYKDTKKKNIYMISNKKIIFFLEIDKFIDLGLQYNQ